MTCGWTRSACGRPTWSRLPAPSRPATATASSTGACSPRPAPRPARRWYYGTTALAWSLADAVELARTIGALLAVARPLDAVDLVLPADAGSAAYAPDAAAEAAARAQAALGQLTSAAAALSQALAAVIGAADGAVTAGQLGALRAALQQAAAFGVDGAYPADDADASALTTLATGIQRELAARQAAATPASQPTPIPLRWPRRPCKRRRRSSAVTSCCCRGSTRARSPRPSPRRPRSSVT